MKSKTYHTAFSILAICGMVITAWGLTWARWNEYRPISSQINLHATLISTAGIGLICLLGVCHLLMKRIEALESALDRMKRGK